MQFHGAFAFNRALTLTEFNVLNDFTGKRHENPYPSAYCQWEATRDGQGLKWDGEEKFRAFKEWLPVLMREFFVPWGLILNGEVVWQGEEIQDRGLILIEANTITFRDSQFLGATVACPKCGHSFTPV
jgi:hypothetical protein